METIVDFNQDHRMLLCRCCQSAVRPGPSIEHHFRNIHRLKGAELREVLDYFQEEELNDPSGGTVPEDGSLAIASLKVHDGFSCTKCRFLTTARDSLNRHWRAAGHDDGGDDANAGGLARWTVVKLQTWLRGRLARYWIVVTTGGNGAAKSGGERGPLPPSVPAPPPSRPPQQPGRGIDIALAACRLARKQRAEERNRAGDAREDIDRESTWVKEMRWIPHFGGRDRLAIAEAAAWTRVRELQKRTTTTTAAAAAWQATDCGRERRMLARLGASFDREVERCCWRLDSVPKETLQWLKSIDPASCSGQPFRRLAQDSSTVKYQSVGQRYLGFCWRAFQLGREAAGERLGVYFTEEQWSLLSDVMFELEAKAEEDRAPSSSSQSLPYKDGPYGTLAGLEEDSSSDDEVEDTEGEPRSDSISGPMRENSAALDRAVFLFFISSIKVRVGGNMYSNALLCFCAALGIQTQPLGFVEAHLYTGKIAALVWLARLFFLEHCFDGEARDLAAVPLETLDRFQRERAQWLCTGTYTVFSKMVNWMSYGKGYRNNTTGAPTVRWSEDKETLFHNGEQISVHDFQRSAFGMVREAESLISMLFEGLWDSIGPGIQMGRIADSMTRVGAGHSFATNPKNSWLEPGDEKVIAAIERTIWDQTRNCWKPKNIRQWLRRLRMLREVLYAAVHVWWGLPGRGPELATVRHTDTWQLMRNVFVYDGMVMIVTDRDKMKAIRDIGRKVARFLPDHLGRIMVAYIAWLLPAEETLRATANMPEPLPDCVEYIWRDGNSKRWDTDRLSAILARMTRSSTGVALNTARYRAVAIEMGRRIRGLVTRQVEQAAGEDSDDEDGAEVDPMTGEPIDTGGSWNIVWDLQSTHGSAIARQHYAVSIGFPGRLPPEMIASYREISRLWHQFLGSSGSSNTFITEGGTKKRKREVSDDAGEGDWKVAGRLDVAAGTARGAKTTAPRSKSEEMTRGLRMLHGAASTWKSAKQMESMGAVLAMRGEEALISVLPTGAGKSTLFMLPAVMRGGGTSIVVVPFVALMDDILDRARAMGISCIQFQNSVNRQRECLPRIPRLVVVSADVALSSGFLTYVDGIRASNMLERIFIDECHTAITDAGYRATLTDLRGLQRFQCPLILLTATLPVALEGWFREAMLARHAVVIRDGTAKPNCRYAVETVGAEPGAVEARVVELVARTRARMLSGQKGVVYCRSRGEAEAMAMRLGCACHHSGMGDSERASVRTAWADGRGHRWIAATTGLGTGIDVGGIVAIVHAGLPYGLVDFVQQTGRGGRRPGEVVESTVVYDGKPLRADQHCGFVEQTNRAQMEAFVRSPSCRRMVLSAFMDGTAGETCRDIAGAELCDRCEGSRLTGTGAVVGRSYGKGEAADVWKRYNMEAGRRVRVLMRWLEEVKEECAVCHVGKRIKGSARQRRAEDCMGKRGKQAGQWCEDVVEEGYEVARKAIRFAAHACCFRCKLPLDWCRDRKEEEEGGAGCCDMDKVLPVVLMARAEGKIQELARERFGVEPRDRGRFYAWLGESMRFHGTKGANMHALWEAIIGMVYGEGEDWGI